MAKVLMKGNIQGSPDLLLTKFNGGPHEENCFHACNSLSIDRDNGAGANRDAAVILYKYKLQPAKRQQRRPTAKLEHSIAARAVINLSFGLSFCKPPKQQRQQRESIQFRRIAEQQRESAWLQQCCHSAQLQRAPHCHNPHWWCALDVDRHWWSYFTDRHHCSTVTRRQQHDSGGPS